MAHEVRYPSRAFTVAAGVLGVAALVLWELVLESSSIPLRELFPVVVGVAAVAGGRLWGAAACLLVVAYSAAALSIAGYDGHGLEGFALPSLSLVAMAYAGAFWHQQGRLQAALLRTANERLATVIREAPVAVYGVDATTDIVKHWNPAAEHLFGWSASEVLGRKFPSVPSDTEEQRRTMMAQLRAGQSVVGMETQRLHKDGLRRDVALSVAPLRSQDHDGVEMLAFGTDITERKRTERALNQALSELFAIVNDTPVAIYTVDAATDAVKLWNPAAERIFGWAADEVLGRPLPIVPPENQEGRRRLKAQVLQGHTVTGREVPALRRDGTRAAISLSQVLLPGADGGPDDVLAFAVDVTARVQAQQEHQRALTELSAILDNSPVAIYAVDGSTDLVKYWNPAAERVFGWRADEVVGKPLPWLPPGGDATRTALRERLLQGFDVTDVEMLVQRQDGSPIEVSLSYGRLAGPEGAPTDVISFCVDITVRRQAQRELQQSREQYRRLVESATDVVYQADITGRFTYVNSMGTRLTGRSEQELLGLRFSELVHPDFRRETSRFYYRQYAGRTPTSYHEFPIVQPDGATVWVGQNVQLLFDTDGRPIGFQAIVRDISDRRAAEQALSTQYAAAELARAEVRAMLDATIDTMIFVACDGTVRAVNRAYYTQIAAGAADELVGRHIDEFSETLATMFDNGSELLAMARRTLASPEGDETLELRQHLPEQKVHLVSSTPVVTPGGEFIGRLFLLRDVTEERALERTKDHLLSMVSHELRTPLASIMGYTELLLSDSEEPPTQRQAKFLSVVMESTNHQLDLVNDLLDISHLNEGLVMIHPEALDLRQAVLGAERSLLPQAEAKGIAITTDAPVGVIAYADRQRVEQVIRNLLSNGIKYTPDRGSISIRLIPGETQVRCEITDTGMGIAEAEQEQVFTRFFRSPAAARTTAGSGLGLAIAKALVELQGGAIGFSSKLGHGSTFWFTLPAVQASPQAPQVAPAPEAAAAH